MLRFGFCFALLLGLVQVCPADAAPCQPEPAPEVAIYQADAWCVAGKTSSTEEDKFRWSLPAGMAGLWHLSLDALPGQGGALYLARYSADGYHQIQWRETLLPDAGRLAAPPLLLTAGDYVVGVAPGGSTLVYRLRVEPAALPAPLAEVEGLAGNAEVLLSGTDSDIVIHWRPADTAPGALWTFALQTPPGTYPGLLLSDAAGAEVTRGSYGDAANVLRLPDMALAEGDYRLTASGLGAGSPAVLSVRQDTRPANFAAEPDWMTSQAHPLTLGAPAIGGLSTSGTTDEHDLFTFVLPPGGTRRIDASVSGPRDSYFTLALVDEGGNALMQRRAQGEVRLRDLALQPGQHWLRVSGSLDPAVTYRVLVEDAGSPAAGTESEPNDIESVAIPSPASQPMTGTFTGDDRDYIDLGVSGGLQLWTVEALGEGLGRLTLYDNLGSEIATASAIAGTAILRLSRVVLPPGRNLLRLDGSNGRWLLRTRALGPPVAGEEIEPNDNDPRALALNLDQPQTGWLDHGSDRDLYSFHLSAEQHVVIELAAPPDVPVSANLAWGNSNSRILRDTTAGTAGEPQTLSWDVLLPPGDYLIDLAAYSGSGSSLDPYRLVVRSASYFALPDDLEPNDESWQARSLPADGRIEGTVSPESGDWYRLPDGLAPAGLQVTALSLPEHGLSIRLARASAPYPETLNSFTLYSAGESRELALPGGDGLLLQFEGGPGRYAMALGAPLAGATPPTLPLTATLQFDAPAVAAYETLGQSLGGRLALHNDGSVALRLQPRFWVADERWTLQGLPAVIDLAAGEAREIPVELKVAPDSRDDRPVAVEIALQAEAAESLAVGAVVAVEGGIAPVGATLDFQLPTTMLGGLNVAAAAFGATTDAAAAWLIDGLIDANGFALSGATPPVIDLAGDAPQSLAGVILQAPPATAPVDRLADFAVEVSVDGLTFQRMLEARLSPLAREQAFAFDAPVEARLVRLVPLSRHGAPNTDHAALVEFKAVAVPTPLSGLNHDIAAATLGGHVVRTLGFGTLSVNGEDAQWPGDWQYTLPVAGQEWILAFRNDRAAEVAAIVWHERPETQPETRMQTVEVAASLAGPLGPWRPLGRWQLSGEAPILTLDQPVWARALAFRLVEPMSGTVALPDHIAVYEAAGGLSILGEWGDMSNAGPYEAGLPATPPPPSLPAVGHTAAEATPLALGSEAIGRVRRGVSEDWYALDLPGDTLWVHADFTGGLAPEVLLTLVDGAGEETTLVQVPNQLGRLMAPAGPGPWKLRVTQPPQSVAVAWDTSASVGALVGAIARAVKQFSWELQPGREEINLFPFRDDATAPLLDAWSGDPAVVYATLHAYPWADGSSDAESALLASARALEERIGTRAVALITDAAYSNVFKDEALWRALERGRVRVFAMHVPVETDPKRALAQVNLMLDWASAGGGTFMRFATQDDGETAFRRITAWLARPADYAFTVTAETTPPPPGTLSVVLNPDAAAVPGAAAAELAVEIVLDASGSMLADLGGRARIEVAQQGLRDLGERALPDGVTVGLRVFGHRGGTSCKSELVLPLAALDRGAFIAAVEKIRVKEKAKTALAESIRLAGADLAKLNGRRVLVLVTDGLETCGGDPEAEIAELRAQGLDVRLNIVGFALDDPAVRATFGAWATAGGGSYFDAADPAALTAAISEAASGLPFVVLDQEGNEIAEGLVGGPALALPAGRYRLLVGEREYAVEILADESTTVVVEQP